MESVRQMAKKEQGILANNTMTIVFFLPIFKKGLLFHRWYGSITSIEGVIPHPSDAKRTRQNGHSARDAYKE